ncbi:hypothetical protein ACIOEZ_27615 [Streptomyces sp. NPDC087866]|uniref:hypothetical protein n=1 Tax=unclassified Streptomyces TaxID=2593676 RepID=UPI00224DDE24|nr:hypothetical protein [Streptomyces sp. NBC_01789]MCX4448387.1 hypothetical protein [Streptomyces sp. NBC_01789]
MSYASVEHVQLAGDIMTWAEGLRSDVENLAIAAAGTLAVVATILAYWKTKSWAGTLAAAVLGAFLVFAVSNIDSLSNMVDSEVPDETSTGSAHLIVTPYEPLDPAVVTAADLR